MTIASSFMNKHEWAEKECYIEEASVKQRIFQNAGKAYYSLLRQLLDATRVPDGAAHDIYAEMVDVRIPILDPDTLIEWPRRKLSKAYMFAEALWDMSPTADLTFLRAFNPRIDEFVANQDLLSRDAATWAYGPAVSMQLPECVRLLREDPTSRQAVISIPRDHTLQGTPPCLVSIQFLIRDDMLWTIVNMRSNDIWLGFPLDVFQFGLMAKVVARGLNIIRGPYIHHAGSLHLYTRDVRKVRDCLNDAPEAVKVAGMPEVSLDDWSMLHTLPAHFADVLSDAVISPTAPLVVMLRYLQTQAHAVRNR